jgi:hypothetical protein
MTTKIIWLEEKDKLQRIYEVCYKHKGWNLKKDIVYEFNWYEFKRMYKLTMVRND